MFPVLEQDDGVVVKVLSGSVMTVVSSPFIPLSTDMTYLDIRFTIQDGMFQFDIPVEWNTVVVCFDGIVQIQQSDLLNSALGLSVA